MPQGIDVHRHQIGWYMRNCANSAAAGRLEHLLLDDVAAFITERTEFIPRDKLTRRALHRLLRCYTSAPLSNESFEKNILYAKSEFGLDAIDVEIVQLLLRYQRNKGLERLVDEVLDNLESLSRAVATLIGIETEEAHRRIIPGGALIDSGMLMQDNEGCRFITGPRGILQLAPPLRKIMFRPYESQKEWTTAIFGAPLTTRLRWEDFEHLGADRELAYRVLSGAVAENAKGINILLHGSIGTGKTELCKAIAGRAGLDVYSVGETDDEGGEPTRGERLASLKIAQHLLKKRRNSIILFDEAEDLFAQPEMQFGPMFEHRGSKVHMNRLLEENEVPVLFTCNSVSRMHPAIRRRMTLAIEVKRPIGQARAAMFHRVTEDVGLRLQEDNLRQLAKNYDAPAGVIANAARAALLAHGDETEFEKAMGGVLQILEYGPGAAEPEGHDFDPRWVNCNEDISRFADSLARPNCRLNWSLLIDGPPGTGKSLFARHLAERLDLQVMQKRASDLMSKYVGETEQQIAQAFAAARAQRAMLVFDEVDSVLSDRREALRGWELAQVNEMLTWMENHPYPVVCTTNLVDRLDRASFRRFTWKLHFKPLTAIQAAHACECFFAISPAQGLPDGLTPGDFANVRHKREIFGSVDSAVLIRWLEEELEAKGERTTSIGFGSIH
jgi:transitional endoplasmic reticulum ATPase